MTIVHLDGSAVTMDSQFLLHRFASIEYEHRRGGMIRLEFDGIDSGVSVQRRLN